VCEVQDDAQLGESAYERAPPFRQPLRGCVDPPGELIRVVPRQTRRADAAFVPLLERAGIALERLHSLHREHEPQPRVLELPARADQAHPLGVRLDRAPELGLLSQRSSTRPLPRRRRAVQRADLDTNAARLEPRQPIPLEQTILALAQDELKRRLRAAADQQLEQHVVMGVNDHDAQSADSCNAHHPAPLHSMRLDTLQSCVDIARRAPAPPRCERLAGQPSDDRNGRASSVSTDDRLTLASVSNCGSADAVVRHDRWSSGATAPAVRGRATASCLEAAARLHIVLLLGALLLRVRR
jgi:hypothetical protein